MENQTSILIYQKADYLENLKVRPVFKKYVYHEIPEIKLKYQKPKF